MIRLKREWENRNHRGESRLNSSEKVFWTEEKLCSKNTVHCSVSRCQTFIS